MSDAKEEFLKLISIIMNNGTFDGTSIEGNTLTLQETALVLNKGVTIGGKSLRDYFC